MWSAAAQELIVTQCAGPPMNAANSCSNSAHSWPCVRMWPSRTVSTACLSASSSHGRPNGIVRVFLSGVLDVNGSSFCERSIGGDTGADDVQLVSFLSSLRVALDDSCDELRDQFCLRSRKGGEVERFRRNLRIAAAMDPRPRIVVDQGGSGPEDADDMLVRVN